MKRKHGRANPHKVEGKISSAESGTVLMSEDQATVDYLHGDVTTPDGEIVEGQTEAACRYEYARESKVLRRLAETYKANGNKSDEFQQWDITEEFLGVPHPQPLGFWWLWMLLGEYYPGRPWRAIPAEMRRVASEELQPLPTLNTARFAAYGAKATAWHDCVRQAFEQAREETRKGNPQQQPLSGPPPAVFREEDGSKVIAGFYIDLNKPKGHLLRQFRAWLELPENTKFLRRARIEPSRVEKAAAGRLHDLAIWRLHRRFDGDVERMRTFILDNRKLDQRGRPRTFHSERRGRGKMARAKDEAMENRDEAWFRKAAGRVQGHLEALLPFETLPELLKQQAAESAGRIDELFGRFFPPSK